MFRASLIIPTYNEAKNLPLLVEEVWSILDKTKIDLEFIIVDDNSPDGTGQAAEELARMYPLKVVHRSGKLGLGSAVRAGFKLSNREILGVMDADLSHDPSILNDLILSLEENDLALGSRFVEKSVVEGWVWWRKALSNVGVSLARILTKTRDPLSGYFFFKREVIAEVDLKTKGYKILLEILVKGKIDKIKEFSYKFRMRKYSDSKLQAGEYLLFLEQLFAYAFYKLTHRKI